MQFILAEHLAVFSACVAGFIGIFVIYQVMFYGIDRVAAWLSPQDELLGPDEAMSKFLFELFHKTFMPLELLALFFALLFLLDLVHILVGACGLIGILISGLIWICLAAILGAFFYLLGLTAISLRLYNNLIRTKILNGLPGG